MTSESTKVRTKRRGKLRYKSLGRQAKRVRLICEAVEKVLGVTEIEKKKKGLAHKRARKIAMYLLSRNYTAEGVAGMFNVHSVSVSYTATSHRRSVEGDLTYREAYMLVIQELTVGEMVYGGDPT